MKTFRAFSDLSYKWQLLTVTPRVPYNRALAHISWIWFIFMSNWFSLQLFSLFFSCAHRTLTCLNSALDSITWGFVSQDNFLSSANDCWLFTSAYDLSPPKIILLVVKFQVQFYQHSGGPWYDPRVLYVQWVLGLSNSVPSQERSPYTFWFEFYPSLKNKSSVIFSMKISSQECWPLLISSLFV